MTALSENFWEVYIIPALSPQGELSSMDWSECQWTNDQEPLPDVRKVSLLCSQHSFSSAMVLAKSLAKVVLDTYIALDNLCAEQGGVCAIANTSCCTWIKASEIVETQLHKIKEQTHWLQQLLPDSLLSFDLFTWLPSGLCSRFRTILQTGFIMLF